MAGLATIPAVVRDPADPAATAAAALGREYRAGRARTTSTSAGAVQQMLELGIAAEEIARTTHTRPENVQAWADVMKLPPKVRKLIDAGRMTASDAYPLVSLLDDHQAMRAALDHITQGYAVDQAVSVVTRDRERERALAASRGKLEAAGCHIVDAPNYGSFPPGSKTRRLGKGHADVHIPVRQHAKLACHAAYISPWEPSKIVYVCTDVTHTPGSKERTWLMSRPNARPSALNEGAAGRERHALSVTAGRRPQPRLLDRGSDPASPPLHPPRGVIQRCRRSCSDP